MIKALHLDDRLIHGQVAISWTRFFRASSTGSGVWKRESRS